MAFKKLFHFLHVLSLVFKSWKAIARHIKILLKRVQMSSFKREIYQVRSLHLSLPLESVEELVLLLDLQLLLLTVSERGQRRTIRFWVKSVKRLKLKSAAQKFRTLIIRFNWILLLLYITICSLDKLLFVALWERCLTS